MATEIISNIQSQLNQLAITFPDLKENQQWAEVLRELEQLTPHVNRQELLETECQRLAAETAALYTGSQAITGALSERQIFEALFEQIRPHHPSEISAFHFDLVSGEPIWAELRASWQKNSHPSYPLGTRFYLPETPQARLMTLNQPLFIEDIATDERLSIAERESFAPTEACSVAILPLMTTGQEMGVVLIYFTAPYTFTETTQSFWLAMVGQAGMALANRQLVRAAAYRAIQMETAAEVVRTASSILDLNELLNTAVALIHDRFDLYYVGAFLVDETKKWAVLQAGTGEIGRQQLQKKYRLKIGDDSLVGWSIHHRQARIALDVGKEAIRFKNLDLPETHSEIVLPLIYRREAIGALTIQSVEQAAFSREDIIFLQTMADQLANAIENARLFQSAQASQTFMKTIIDQMPDPIFIKDREQKCVVVNRAFAQGLLGLPEKKVLGRTDYDYFPREVADWFRDQDLKMFETGQTQEAEGQLINALGQVRAIYARKVPLLGDNGQSEYLIGIINDITERKQAEEALKESLKRTQLLYNISEALATLTDQQAAFETVLGEYLLLLNLNRGGISLFEQDSDHHRIQALYIDNRVVTESNLTFPVSEDLVAQYLIENPLPLIIEDAHTHPLTKHNQELRGQVESMLLIPLTARGEVIGILGADTTEKDRTFTSNDIEIGKVIADLLSIWLENRQLLTEAQYRSERLQAVAEVSRAVSSILDADELIETSVNLIREQFDFYYVALFLVDETKEWAVLRAGTGEMGQLMLKRKHQIEIAGESLIGWCIQNRKPRLASQEIESSKSPLLPNVHSEVALPLISRHKAIGALNIQSEQWNAFSTEDITLLQTLADQLANVIENARLFENTTQAQKEAEYLLQDTQALQLFSQALAGTLQVNEILNIFFQACTKVIGFEYVQFSLVDKYQHRIKAIAGIGLSDSHIQRSNRSLESNDIMVDIIKTGQTEIITGWDDRFDRETYEAERHHKWVRVFTPITLRQENIGLVETGFNKNTRTTIQESQIRLLRAFIDQTALALDNAQRYEASQKVARREALIKEITTRVRASTDLDTILQTTVKEVGDALGGKRAYVYLVSPTNGESTGSK